MKVKRIIAFMIDLSIVSGILILPSLILEIYFNQFISSDFITRFGLILLLFKDITFKNASIGKKIMKLEIKDNNGKKASFLKLILRNILNILWSIDLLIVLVNNKKIMDIILNTSVVEIENKKKNNS